VNLGAQRVRAAAGDATIEEIAVELGIERTYCGRVLSDTRPASLAVRRKAKERYGVEYDDWDQKVPDPEQPAHASNPTGTDS
jgi:hypothetical protein